MLGDDINVAHMEVTVTVLRSLARTRAFPILAWFYLVALAVQVFFAGMYVFVGASNRIFYSLDALTGTGYGLEGTLRAGSTVVDAAGNGCQAISTF